MADSKKQPTKVPPKVPNPRTGSDVLVPRRPPGPSSSTTAAPAPPPAPPYHPPRMWNSPAKRPPRRSWQVVLLVLAAVAVLVVGFVILLHPLLTQPDTTAQGTTDSSSVPFEPPVALARNESYVQTTVRSSGDLAVTQWIHSVVPLFDVTLAVPQVDGADAITATDVVVAADGRVVNGATSVEGREQSYQFFGARAVSVSYVLTGAVADSPSEPGRALARVTSLDVGYASVHGTSTRSVEGAQVLSMACTPLADPGATPTPCGEPAGDGWQVELRGPERGARVMAQLQLE